MPTPRRDITGLRSGKLTAIAPYQPTNRFWLWTARCDCGTERIVRSSRIVCGTIKSCGCGPKRGGHNAGQLKWGTETATNPTYRSWAAMINRCTNPNTGKAWERYGAQGITVCPQWRTFTGFMADMGERLPGTSLDRYPNPAGNYEPGNCRWATAHEQANNKRKRNNPEG